MTELSAIGFRPNAEDSRILQDARREGESTSDVLRRALRALDQETWLAHFHADAERISGEDLSAEPDAW